MCLQISRNSPPTLSPTEKSISQKIVDLFLKTKEFASKYPLHFSSREFVKFRQEKKKKLLT
jgi:hypothetical protein